MTVEELLVIAHDEKNSKKSWAEDELVKIFQNLVKFYARVYFLAGSDTDDLEQIGRMGLLEAIRSYKPEKGTKFSTYASHCLRNELLTEIGKSCKNFVSVVDIDSLDEELPAEFTEESIVNMIYYKVILEQFLKDATCLEHNVTELYIQGYSYSEIGKLLSVTNKTIDNTIQRVRKKIIRKCANFQ